MIAPLDVFALRVDLEHKWLGSAGTYAKAAELIQKTGPGEYFVFSQKTHRKTFYKVGQDGTISLAEVR